MYLQTPTIASNEMENIRLELIQWQSEKSLFLPLWNDIFALRYTQVFQEQDPTWRAYTNRVYGWDRYMVTPIEFLINFFSKTFSVCRFRPNAQVWIGPSKDEIDRLDLSFYSIKEPSDEQLKSMIDRAIGSIAIVPIIHLGDLYHLLVAAFGTLMSERLFLIKMRELHNEMTLRSKIVDDVWIRSVALAQTQLILKVENLFNDFCFIPIKYAEQCFINLYREESMIKYLSNEEFSDLGDWLVYYSKMSEFKLLNGKYVYHPGKMQEWKEYRLKSLEKIHDQSDLYRFTYEMESLIPYDCQVPIQDFGMMHEHVYRKQTYSSMSSPDFCSLIKRMENKFSRARGQMSPERTIFFAKVVDQSKVEFKADWPPEKNPCKSELRIFGTEIAGFESPEMEDVQPAAFEPISEPSREPLRSREVSREPSRFDNRDSWASRDTFRDTSRFDSRESSRRKSFEKKKYEPQLSSWFIPQDEWGPPVKKIEPESFEPAAFESTPREKSPHWSKSINLNSASINTPPQIEQNQQRTVVPAFSPPYTIKSPHPQASYLSPHSVSTSLLAELAAMCNAQTCTRTKRPTEPLGASEDLELKAATDILQQTFVQMRVDGRDPLLFTTDVLSLMLIKK